MELRRDTSNTSVVLPCDVMHPHRFIDIRSLDINHGVIRVVHAIKLNCPSEILNSLQMFTADCQALSKLVVSVTSLLQSYKVL
jgi:hypothetical protein